MKYKNIVPGLISFETNLNKLSGFGLSENFNFYEKVAKKNKFHYTIKKVSNLHIPDGYNFRNGFTFVLNNKFYFKRKLKLLEIKLAYDPKLKTFEVSKSFDLIPFTIGGIDPPGKILWGIIFIDLLKNKILTLRGCSFIQNANVKVVSGPSYNGKTSLLKHVLRSGGKYISEDNLIVDCQNWNVFPTAPINNFGRKTNKELGEHINKSNLVKIPNPINQFYLMHNSTKNANIIKISHNDFLPTIIPSLFNSTFVTTYMSIKNFTRIYEKILKMLSKKNSLIKTANINNFNFEKILNE